MMSKKMIRVIAIIMAALMIIAVFAVALDTFAVDAAVVYTGDNDGVLIAGIAAGAALIAVICCVVLPKLKKKGENNET